MRSLNTIFVAVVAGLSMCFAQLGQAQNQTHYPNAQAYFDSLPVGLVPDYISNVRRMYLSDYSMYGRFHGSPHSPNTWDVGVIYERTYNSPSLKSYAGPINWYVFSPLANVYDSGTSTFSISSNVIRVSDANIKAGDIYCLIAELDGEWYGGQDSLSLDTSGSPRWAMNDTWLYPLAGHTFCGVSCTKWTFLNISTDTNNAYRHTIGGRHEIRIHPKSTVSVASVHTGPSSNLRVQYVKNVNGVRKVKHNDKWITAPNQLSTPLCTFHVDYNSNDFGFEVHYDGCWHPVPRLLSPCTSLCFEVNTGNLPVGRVTRTLKRYDVPITGSAWVFDNTETIQYTHTNSPIAFDMYGQMQFTPPAGQTYKVYVETLDGLGLLVPLEAAPASPQTLPTLTFYPTNTPVQTSPNNGAAYVNGSTVPFSWNAALVPGQSVSKYYWWIAHENDASWTVYDVGTSRNIGVGVTGLGDWYWFVQAYNTQNQLVAESALRYFEMVQQRRGGPSMSDQPGNTDRFLEQSELVGGGFDVFITVRDENGDVLLPIQGRERELLLGDAPLDVDAVLTDHILENELIELEHNARITNIRALMNKNGPNHQIHNIGPEQDLGDVDWEYLLLTPEELMFEFWLRGLEDL